MAERTSAERNAVAAVLLSGLMFALAGAAGKLLAAELGTFGLVFWRNLLSFAVLIAWLVVRGFPDLGTDRFGLHALRAVLSYGALLTYFFAIAHVPLASAVLLQSTSPIFVPVLALLVLRRLSDRFVWLGVTLGLAGVAFIVQPAELGLSAGELGGVAAGAMGGAATLAIWAMSGTEPPLRQMVYFTLLTLLLAAAALPWTWQLPDPGSFAALLALAICTTLAQHLLAVGCSLAPADKIITWSYGSIVFATLIGFFAWREPIAASALLGVALVVLGAHLASR